MARPTTSDICTFQNGKAGMMPRERGGGGGGGGGIALLYRCLGKL